jgi:hypothetical protein
MVPRPQPRRLTRLATCIVGELIIETFEFDGGRQVTAYIPPDPPEAVVFAGDGQVIAPWGVTLEEADVPSTMIVGVHRLDDETLRIHEYSPGFDPDASPPTSSSSSKSSGDGRGHASASTSPLNAPRCSVSRRVENLHCRWDSDIPTSTVHLVRLPRRRVPTA